MRCEYLPGVSSLVTLPGLGFGLCCSIPPDTGDFGVNNPPRGFFNTCIVSNAIPAARLCCDEDGTERVSGTGAQGGHPADGIGCCLWGSHLQLFHLERRPQGEELPSRNTCHEPKRSLSVPT